jgi:hypothetical protein
MKLFPRSLLGRHDRYPTPRRRRPRPAPRSRPFLERLEDRSLPTITLTGVPSWLTQGPGPITAGQVEGIAPDGPVSGAVNAIAVHPSQPGTLLIGAVNGGIWRTTSATPGNTPTWTPVTDQFPSLSIGAIAFAPGDVNILYAGAGRFSSLGRDGGPAIGLLKSSDGGRTWELKHQLGQVNISSLAPIGNGQVVFAAADDGLWRSTNGGDTFTLLQGTVVPPDGRDNDGNGTVDEPNERSLPNGRFDTVLVDPGDANRIYAARPGRGVFRSEDQGNTWTRVDTGGITGAGGAAGLHLAISSAVDSVTRVRPVYAAVIGPGLTGLFRSANRGTTWTAMDLPRTREGLGVVLGIHPGRQGGLHFSMAADPSNPFVVFVGGDRQPVVSDGAFFPNVAGSVTASGRIFRGNAALPAGATTVQATGEVGLQWQQVVVSNASGTSPHADSRAMAFDGFGDLIEADDGGIYRLVNPNNVAGGGNRRWESLLGNLAATEFHSVAYNNVNNRLFGGTQDNGNVEQTTTVFTTSTANRTRWRQIFPADGSIAQVDPTNTLFGAANPLRYFSTQNFGRTGLRVPFLGDIVRGFFRQGVLDPLPTVIGLRVAGTGGRTLTGPGLLGGGNFDNTIQFVQPFVLNAVDPTRMLIGTDFLYESLDRGDNVTSLGGLVNLTENDIDEDGDGLDGPPRFPFLDTPDPDEFRPTGRIGTVRALAYGGRENGQNRPEVGYAGTDGNGPLLDPDGPGPQAPRQVFLFLRGRGSALFSPFDPVFSYPGAGVRDLVIDRENFRTVFVLDRNSRVWRSRDAGATWSELTGNLATGGLLNFPVLLDRPNVTTNISHDLRTIELVGTGLNAVVLVGGLGGVFRLDPNAEDALWHEYGAGLPNMLVTDLRYDPTDDVLVAGTFGRGAWTIRDVMDDIRTQGVLLIEGTTGDDQIRLVRNRDNPLLLDVTITSAGGTETRTVQVSVLHQIDIRGGDGADTLTIDAVNGPIAVPGNLDYDGGTGGDTLVLLGAGATQDVYVTDVETTGSSSQITFTGPLTQTVNLRRVQAVQDLVAGVPGGAGLELIVTARFEDNTLTLDNGTSSTDGLLRVQILDTEANRTFAPIEFANKAELTLNGDPGSLLFGGDDTINLAFSEVATGLTKVNVFGRNREDTINVTSIAVATEVSGGSGSDTINVGSAAGGLGLLQRGSGLAGIDAALSIDGGASADTLNVLATGGVFFGRGQGLAGELNGTTLTGLGMAGSGLIFASVSTVTISLGGGDDTFAVRGTAAGVATTLSTGGGSDLIRVGSTGTGTGGTVNNIDGALTIDGGSSPLFLPTFDTLVVDDSGETANSTGAVTPTMVTGLGLAQGINHSALERIDIRTGSGNDTVSNSVPAGSPPTVNIDLDGGENGLVFDGTDGNDVIRVRWEPASRVLVQINDVTIATDYTNCRTIFVFAGPGDDRVQMDPSASIRWRAEFFGEGGHDSLFGSLFDDLLDGGEGNDVLGGDAGTDELRGGPGANTLLPGGRADQVSFVVSLYRDMLGRMYDSAGLVSWVDQLGAGASRTDVARGIWASAEYRGVQVDGYYARFLHRAADPEGRAFWVGALLAGAGETAVMRAFLTSSEYMAAHPDAAAFVAGLYEDVVGSAADDGGQLVWQQLVRRFNREVVTQLFLTARPAQARMLDDYYTGYLHRPADVSEQQTWLTALDSQYLSPALVGQAFLGSDEYYARSMG